MGKNLSVPFKLEKEENELIKKKQKGERYTEQRPILLLLVVHVWCSDSRNQAPSQQAREKGGGREGWGSLLSENMAELLNNPGTFGLRTSTLNLSHSLQRLYSETESNKTGTSDS